jgi:hypothetical protein
VELNMIRNLHVRDGKVTFTLPYHPNCRCAIRSAPMPGGVEALPGVAR